MSKKRIQMQKSNAAQGVTTYQSYTRDRSESLELENAHLRQALFDLTGASLPQIFTEQDDFAALLTKDSYTRAEMVQAIRLARYDEFMLFSTFAKEEYDPVTTNSIEIMGLLQFFSAIVAVREAGMLREVVKAYPVPDGIALDEYIGVLGLRLQKHAFHWETPITWDTRILSDLAVGVAKLLETNPEIGDNGETLRQAVERYSRFTPVIKNMRKGMVKGGAKKKDGWREVADEVLNREWQPETDSQVKFIQLQRELESKEIRSTREQMMLEVMQKAPYESSGDTLRKWISLRQKELNPNKP